MNQLFIILLVLVMLRCEAVIFFVSFTCSMAVIVHSSVCDIYFIIFMEVHERTLM